MRLSSVLAASVFALTLSALPLCAQTNGHDSVAPAPHVKQIHLKHVLVIGQTKGFEHDSISAAMDAIFQMGKQSGLWDTMLRTDTELLTKKEFKGNNAKNLNYFDAIFYFGTGEGALIGRERQRKLLQDTADALERSIAAVGAGEELLAEELRAAAQSLGRLLGRVDVEDILDVIFKEFCIGK